METIKLIISIISGIIGIIITGTGFLIPLIKNVKAKNALAFISDTAKFANELMVKYETEFWDIADAAKKAGLTIGGFKKEMVMSAVKGKYSDSGKVFDDGYWSSYIDEYVSESRKINSAVKTDITLPPAA